jgi:hypothetical protein
MTGRINLAELRAAAAARPYDGEPEGHVCMTGDYALALIDAVEAAHALVDFFGIQHLDDLGVPGRFMEALARFDFGDTP